MMCIPQLLLVEALSTKVSMVWALFLFILFTCRKLNQSVKMCERIFRNSVWKDMLMASAPRLTCILTIKADIECICWGLGPFIGIFLQQFL